MASVRSESRADENALSARRRRSWASSLTSNTRFGSLDLRLGPAHAEFGGDVLDDRGSQIDPIGLATRSVCGSETAIAKRRLDVSITARRTSSGEYRSDNPRRIVHSALSSSARGEPTNNQVPVVARLPPDDGEGGTFGVVGEPDGDRIGLVRREEIVEEHGRGQRWRHEDREPR